MQSSLHRVVLLLAFSATALVGCATGPIATPQAIQYYQKNANEVIGKSSLVVGEGCVIRNEVGTSHLVKNLSLETARLTSEKIAKALTAKGNPAKPQSSPFFCSNFKQEVFSDYTIKDNPDADRLALPSFPFSAGVNIADSVSLALKKVLEEVYATTPTIDTDVAKFPARITLQSLEKKEAELLKQTFGADYLWVVNSTGTQVSFGRKFGVALLTASLSIAAGGGINSARYYTYSMPVDGSVYTVAVVDINAQQLIWKKVVPAQNADPFKLENFNDA